MVEGMSKGLNLWLRHPLLFQSQMPSCRSEVAPSTPQTHPSSPSPQHLHTPLSQPGKGPSPLGFAFWALISMSASFQLPALCVSSHVDHYMVYRHLAVPCNHLHWLSTDPPVSTPEPKAIHPATLQIRSRSPLDSDRLRRKAGRALSLNHLNSSALLTSNNCSYRQKYPHSFTASYFEQFAKYSSGIHMTRY